ncbi:hypothetical protein ES708_05892 [subsurface metagenome]
MARIKTSELISSIAGMVGDHIYSCWKGQQYIMSKPVTISRPCSPAQSAVTASVTAISRMWYSALTEAQRAGWNEFAQQLGSASDQRGANLGGGTGVLQVIPRDGGVMSGFNSFVKTNVVALMAGFIMASPPVPNAPLGIDAPNAPTDLLFAFYCSLPAQPCRVYLSWTDPIGAPVGSIIRVWTVSLDSGAHRQIVKLVALGETDTDILQVKAALGALINIEDLPGHYHFQIDCISPSGLKSPPSNVITVNVTPTCDACIP